MILMDNITYGYSKNEYLFNDLDFNTNSGRIIGLLGIKGAGKSTLLKLIAGLLRPKTGTIIVSGYVPLKRNPNFLTESFFINETVFYPNLSIENYTKVLSPFYRYFDVDKMQKILKEFEINDSLMLNEISLGQQKKFIIAFALATNSKLLLLDEPTNDLDAASKSVFRKVLVNSIDKHQTVIVTSHQVKDVERIIDEIVILEKGEIVFQKDVLSLAKKLAFQKISTLENNDAVLYSEKCAEGYKAIFKANSVSETEIDIELLFNAVTNNIQFKI